MIHSEPWWVRILERLGLPTFLLLVFLWVGWQVYQDAKIGLAQASDQITEALDEVTTEHALAFLLEHPEMQYMGEPVDLELANGWAYELGYSVRFARREAQGSGASNKP